MIDNDQITALAREYAEQTDGSPAEIAYRKAIAENAFRFLSRRFCFVEKSKAVELCRLTLEHGDSVDYGLIDGLTGIMCDMFPEQYQQVAEGLDNPRNRKGGTTMKQIYTKCHSFEEANALGHFIMSKGYEGVQNDSYRYCEDHIRWALKYNRRHHREYCFVGVNGGCMVVGKNKKEMRRKLSMKYIEKERIFRELLSMAYDFSRLGKEVEG